MTSIYGQIFNKSPLSPSHQKIIELVRNFKYILELGSSTGYLTKEFKKNGSIVDIVEKDLEDIKRAKKYVRIAYLGSLEDDKFLSQIKNKYEVVVAADVIEHLKEPEKILDKIRKWLKKDGKLIISLPNVASWQIRKELFFNGNFDYTDEGILDKTHLRFFTYKTSCELLKSKGFKIINIFQMETDYPFKRTILRLNILGWIFDKMIGAFIVKRFPNLSTGHIIFEVKVND